jgi:hypothetical protein
VGHSYYILIKINCNKGLDSQNVYPATLIYLPIPSQECVSLCICARCINFTYIYDLILDFFYSVVYLVFSCSYIIDICNWTGFFHSIPSIFQMKTEFDSRYILPNPGSSTRIRVWFLSQATPSPFGGWWTGLNDKTNEGYWTYYTSYDKPPSANIM